MSLFTVSASANEYLKETEFKSKLIGNWIEVNGDTYFTFTHDEIFINGKAYGKYEIEGNQLKLSNGKSGDVSFEDRYLILAKSRYEKISEEELNKLKKDILLGTKLKLSKEKVNEDLDRLKKIVEDQFSYLKANNVAYIAAIDAIKGKNVSQGGMTINQLALEIDKFIALFIDGHARIKTDYDRPNDDQFLPFLIESIKDKYIAFYENRENFVEKDYPYIVSINGVVIDDWIKVASRFYPKGSPQYQKRNGLRILRNIGFLQSQMNLNATDQIEVILQSKDGKTLKKHMKVANEKPYYGDWPKDKVDDSRIVDNNMGYLRIEDMEDIEDEPEYIEKIKQKMSEFKNTKALVIDVRSNGGGTRDILYTVFPYFMSNRDKSVVINATVYKKSGKFDPDHLESRRLYRENSTHWTKEEKQAISDFKKNFVPQIKYNKDDFSDMHYGVISNKKTKDMYYYDKPVYILIDEKCFSATDVFVSAFKGMKNITLIGRPTGGGSARSRTVFLKNSRLKIKMGSMISFQKNGLLFDTNGIKPDIYVEVLPEYFLKNGKDNILQKAIDVIQ